MDKKTMAKVLNEWQRRHIENPTQFETKFRMVKGYLKDIANGIEPSYGKICVEYMYELETELDLSSRPDRKITEGAEISFRAGIKEVVDWIEQNTIEDEFHFRSFDVTREWQSKLKEWGIGRLN